MDILTPYLRRFHHKIKRCSDEELIYFDEIFSGLIQPMLERIAIQEELTESEKQRFIDLVYKILFVKGDFDERYDNVLIAAALKRVKK